MRSHRYYERQIDKLLAIIEKQNDRIMYLAGREWEPAPAATSLPPSLDEMLDDHRYQLIPEQYPIED